MNKNIVIAIIVIAVLGAGIAICAINSQSQQDKWSQSGQQLLEMKKQKKKVPIKKIF